MKQGRKAEDGAAKRRPVSRVVPVAPALDEEISLVAGDCWLGRGSG